MGGRESVDPYRWVSRAKARHKGKRKKTKKLGRVARVLGTMGRGSTFWKEWIRDIILLVRGFRTEFNRMVTWRASGRDGNHPLRTEYW